MVRADRGERRAPLWLCRHHLPAPPFVPQAPDDLSTNASEGSGCHRRLSLCSRDASCILSAVAGLARPQAVCAASAAIIAPPGSCLLSGVSRYPFCRLPYAAISLLSESLTISFCCRKVSVSCCSCSSLITSWAISKLAPSSSSM